MGLPAEVLTRLDGCEVSIQTREIYRGARASSAECQSDAVAMHVERPRRRGDRHSRSVPHYPTSVGPRTRITLPTKVNTTVVRLRLPLLHSAAAMLPPVLPACAIGAAVRCARKAML